MKVSIIYKDGYVVEYNAPEHKAVELAKCGILYKNPLTLLSIFKDFYSNVTSSLSKERDITVCVSSERIIYKGKSYNEDNFSLEPKMSLVQFEYNGGTNYGETRYVRVDSEDDKYLVGKDLQKDEERRYLKSKMRNFVRLV